MRRGPASPPPPDPDPIPWEASNDETIDVSEIQQSDYLPEELSKFPTIFTAVVFTLICLCMISGVAWFIAEIWKDILS